MAIQTLARCKRRLQRARKKRVRGHEGLPRREWLPVCLAALLAVNLPIACGSGKPASESGRTAGIDIGPLRTPAGGSAQFRRVPGGGNGTEQYGHESDSANLKEAASAVHGYLVARAKRDWKVACSYVARAVVEELRGFTSASPKSCPKMMASIAVGEPRIADTAYEATEVIAGSFRVKGSYGYLFFNPRTNAAKMLMFREGREWKVDGLLPTQP